MSWDVVKDRRDQAGSAGPDRLRVEVNAVIIISGYKLFVLSYLLSPPKYFYNQDDNYVLGVVVVSIVSEYWGIAKSNLDPCYTLWGSQRTAHDFCAVFLGKTSHFHGYLCLCFYCFWFILHWIRCKISFLTLHTMVEIATCILYCSFSSSSFLILKCLVLCMYITQKK